MSQYQTHNELTTHEDKTKGNPENNKYYNAPAKGISYFTPAQFPPAGTLLEAADGQPKPKLFTPLEIRGMTMQNRIMLSPLCQYSAEDGHYTPWHITHLGGILQRGPGLTTVEATAVMENGRITPQDNGLWKDSQIGPLSQIVEFAHSQGQKIMIQLAHAGRKASTVAPWISGGMLATEDIDGWPDSVWAPSAIPFSDTYPKPLAMSKAQIEEFKSAWGASVKRALKVGFDCIEIHVAHGYLLHEFLSGVSNTRTDEYGGSFENRTRIVLETVKITRDIIPKDMPLFLRISATDWLEENENKELVEKSWKVEDTVKLAKILAESGVDVLDVSSGGNHEEQHIHAKPAYQAPFALAVKKEVGDKMLVGTVGSLDNAKLAEKQLQQGLDIATVGRGFQKNPGLVFAWADELGVKVRMPNQIAWGFAGRGKK
ncbi:NADH:flavin oxidoreductase/NADH oxidase [Microthyrium microscopicum]|uniref:NADH:flavin oxidoreductase/NADH oxidase n=1 Tax=Microthyrium microscopicum TaxID=703497 RepID=A0A6A6UGD5_9PEZI|nr:NADH:flavin oxidoreductase/NADH oxidase [Microthyrium microscopicum]